MAARENPEAVFNKASMDVGPGMYDPARAAQAAHGFERAYEYVSGAARGAARGATRGSAAPASLLESMFSNAGGSIASGVGSGLAQGAMQLVGGALGSAASAAYKSLVLEPKRKQLLEGLLKNDPVLSDSVKRNPNAQTLVLEAYGTMSKFAPTLSLDINAVRSFLREAVLSGSGVSYAAIKNLIETEQALKGRGGKK